RPCVLQAPRTRLCPMLFLPLHVSAPRGPLHSFPTRRSSDLRRRVREGGELRGRPAGVRAGARAGRRARATAADRARRPARAPARSEEHTSELQSPDHLVCRLLLEKKKNTRYENIIRY